MTSTRTLQARGVAAALAERLPTPSARPLAAPPPGSGLQPVMGDPGLPIVGHTLGVLSDALALSRRFHAQFGTVFWGNIFGTRLVLVLGPEGIETVLANRDRAFA